MDKKPQIMYICPKQCEGCPLGEPHYDSGDCGKAYTLCPACIPYVEPSPKDCSKCGQLDCDRAEPQPEPMPLIDTEPTCIKCLAKKRGERIDCPRLVYGYCKKHLEAQRDADMAWHLEKVLQVRKDFAEECQQFYQAKSNRWQGFAAKTNMLMTYLNLNNGDRIYTEIYSAYKLGIADALAHLRAMVKE